jgi:hypothetical protein
MAQDWGEEMGQRIAAEVKRLRGDRSAQWLSDRTAELGYRITRSRISAMETGRHSKIGVDELIIIAAALEVAPIQLVYPGLPNADTDALPYAPTTAWNALLWFSGEWWLDYSDRNESKMFPSMVTFMENSEHLRLLREHREAVVRLHRLSAAAASALKQSDAPGNEVARDFVKMAAWAFVETTQNLEAIMQSSGIEIPEFSQRDAIGFTEEGSR